MTTLQVLMPIYFVTDLLVTGNYIDLYTVIIRLLLAIGYK